jgi:tripartite-type tricarboxylate transporter receptor subunit TctC
MKAILTAVIVTSIGIGSAAAETWPSKTVTIIVPAAAGGLTDSLTRMVAQKLSQKWGQSVVIENRGGGGHSLGAAAVAKAAPDGYTLMGVEAGTFVAGPFLYRNLPFDAGRDFAPIAGLAASAMAWVVHPSVPARNARELIGLAKSKPKTITYGTAGIGSSLHYSVLLLESMAGVTLSPVHYRGASPAYNDLIGGHIQMISFGPTMALSAAREGKVNIVAVGGLKRSPQLPDVPTVDESGLPGYDASNWFGLFAPANTSREIVARINADVRQIMSDPELRQRYLTPQLLEPILGSPDEFRQFIAADARKWGKVIRDANLSLD